MRACVYIYICIDCFICLVGFMYMYVYIYIYIITCIYIHIVYTQLYTNVYIYIYIYYEDGLQNLAVVGPSKRRPKSFKCIIIQGICRNNIQTNL